MSLIKQLIPNEKDNFSLLSNQLTLPKYLARFDPKFKYLISGGAGGAKYNKNIKIENEVSFSIWFKVSSFLDKDGNSKGMHLIDMRTSDTWGYQPIYIDDSKIQYHRRYDGNSGISFEFSTSFETGKWYHICIRAKNEAGKIECWLNGQKLSGTFTDNPLPIQGEFPLYIGSRFNAGADYFLDGQIKDVRIYNHWVSDYEIKELSKGLCCHYSFDDASNLLVNSEKYTKNSPLVRQGSFVDNWELSDMQCELVPNQTYIFQFKCNGNYSGTHYGNGGTGVDPSNRLCSVWFYLGKDSIPTANSADSFFYIPKSDVKDGPNGCRYYIYKNTSGYKYLKVRTNAYSNGTDQITINFWDFKLTLGDKLTPWTPYNSVYKISDNSGFNNNSTKVNNVGVTSSKIGSGAGLFNGADSYVALPTSCKINPPFTYNIWAYMDNWANYGNDGQRIISCTEGGGFNLEAPSNTIDFAFHNGATPNGYDYNLKTGVTVDSLGESNWHMFTFSINNQEAVGYIDGVEVARNSYTGTLTYNSLNTIYIGAEAGGDDEGSALSCYFNGKIDDFRLYSSVLSPEDIKDLYNCRCVIDNKHNMKASSYKEENSTFNINSNGTVECTDFIENEYLYTKDGAKFLKIFEHDIRKYPEFFTDEDEAKKFVGKNRFSRLIDLSDSSFKSISENKYEFILRYPEWPEEYQEVEYIRATGTQYILTGVPVVDDNGESISWEHDIKFNVNSQRQLMGYNDNSSYWGITSDGYYETYTASTIMGGNRDIVIFKNGDNTYINGQQGQYANGPTVDDNGESYKYQLFALNYSPSCYADLYGCVARDGSGNAVRNFVPCYKKSTGEVGLYDLVTKEFFGNAGTGTFEKGQPCDKHLKMYNRWKQASDPNTSLKDADPCDPIYLTMTKQWNGKGLGLSTYSGKGASSYMECQSGSSGWFGSIGQVSNAYADGFPAPDGNPYQHVQLWVRVDNTNYNKSGNSISKSIVNQYMKFDNSTPAINTGVTLTSNSKVSVSFKCNSDMNRGCIVFGQGALEQLSNTFEMYVWQLGGRQQIQLNIGKENITYGISDFTANTVYNVDVYGDGNYVINGTSGKLDNHVCGTASLANTCLIGAIHRRQNENDPYTEYRTITDGVVTQIDKFEIWEKDGNGNYSILKYRYYSPQYICTADNFIED